MPTFFVSLLYLNSIGFEKLESRSKETLDAAQIAMLENTHGHNLHKLLYFMDVAFTEDYYESIDKLRMNEINNITEMQFLLSYMGNISKKDSDDMTVFELHKWLDLLKKQKELENKDST